MPRLPIPLLLGLAASAAALALQLVGLLQPAERVAMDTLMRLRGPQPADERVVVCDIDAASIDAYGQWPWPRTRVAEVIDRLAEAGARTIALDVVFSEPSRSDGVVDLSFEDEALAAAMERAGNVVLGFYFQRGAAPVDGEDGNEEGGGAGGGAERLPGAVEQVLSEPPGGFRVPRRRAVERNLPLFEEAAAAQGFFSNERRSSGVLRHYDLLIAHAPPPETGSPRYFPALALRAVALYAGADLRLSAEGGDLPRLELIPRQNGVPPPGLEGPGAAAGAEVPREVVADESGALWVNYRGPARTYRTVPVVDLLEGRVEPGSLAGTLVFLGASETGIGDLQATPFGSEMPGVEVHANVADNLLAGNYVRDTGVQHLVSLAALLLIGPLTALLVGGGRHYLIGSLAAIALVAAWPAVAYAAFAAAGWHLQVTAPATAGLIALVAALRYQVGTVDARAREIRSAFSRYVSGAVVEEILRDPEQLRLGGESREMTVLFSDLRGFTSLSEHMDPEGVVRLLNRFFTPMTRMVLAEGGTLDKYMGDALMAFFGAPVTQEDHALRACRAALAMRQELARINRAMAEAGELPEGGRLAIGIGLASGEMAVGNMGSEEVFDYTVIGDNVNLGSRIEGLNKLYGTEILLPEATRSAAEAAAPGAFLFRRLDRVRVKGKEEPVELYELVGTRPRPEEEDFVARFEAALTLHQAADCPGAAEAFAALAAERPDDGAVRLYVERCRAFLAEPPPPGWDGVHTLTSK